MTDPGIPADPALSEILASIRRLMAEQNAIGERSSGANDVALPAALRSNYTLDVPLPCRLLARPAEAVSTESTPPPLRPEAPRLAALAKAADPGARLRRAAPENDDVPREMPSCMDRVVSRMSRPVPPPHPGLAEAAAPLPSSSERVVARMGEPARPPQPEALTAAKPLGRSLVPKARLRVNYLVGAASTAGAGSNRPSNTSEGVDGQLPDPNLLRPLLRQWLNENIARTFIQVLAASSHDGKRSP